MIDLLPTWFVLGVAGVLGALVGSYLNVVAWRVPQGQSTAWPPSACPSCRHTIRAIDNIPLLSWLMLRGRCRDCLAPISAQYPLVEAGMAALFVTGVLALRDEMPVLVMLAVLALAAGGTALTIIDLEHHRLPIRVTLGTAAVVAALLVAHSATSGDWVPLLWSAVGAVAFFVAYFALLVVYPAGMGAGDVKLAPLLGGVLGWFGITHLVVGFFAPFLVGGLVVAGLAVRGKVQRGTGIPFGPSMVLGTLLAVVVAPELAGWYLSVTGLA